VVPSRWHRTKIRWRHGGIAGASRNRVPFLGSSCFLRIVFLRRLHRWSHEVKTKTTRFDKMASRRPYEAQNWHTNSTRKWTFAMSSGNFLACQTFCDRSRCCCRCLQNLAGVSYVCKRCTHEWPNVITTRSEFEHFFIRVSILCQIRDSVTPALRNKYIKFMFRK
jgi:hypothetical protein